MRVGEIRELADERDGQEDEPERDFVEAAELAALPRSTPTSALSEPTAGHLFEISRMIAEGPPSWPARSPRSTVRARRFAPGPGRPAVETVSGVTAALRNPASSWESNERRCTTWGLS